jgi:hypothetical protein
MSLAILGGRSATALSALSLLALLVPAPAAAGPILPGVWYEFSFLEPPLPAMGCDPADPAGLFCVPSSGTPTSFADAPPWTFTVPAGGGSFLVTDAYTSGDQFEVFDLGVSRGLTSPPGSMVDCGSDPIPCLANPDVSRGVYFFDAGSHSVTIVPTAVPGGGGAGYFRVDTTAAPVAVPEPASLMLVALGLGPLVRRRFLG